MHILVKDRPRKPIYTSLDDNFQKCLCYLLDTLKVIDLRVNVWNGKDGACSASVLRKANLKHRHIKGKFKKTDILRTNLKHRHIKDKLKKQTY